jgi:hypothetical protein
MRAGIDERRGPMKCALASQAVVRDKGDAN